MRRLCVLPIVLLAACGPRAVLGHGTSAPRATRDDLPVATPTWGPPGALDSHDLRTTDDASVDRPSHANELTTVRAPEIADVSAASVAARTPDGAMTTDGGMTSDGEPTSGIVISRLPAPHRIAAADAPLPRTAEDALALVGHRDARESFVFALAVASSVRGGAASMDDGTVRTPSAVADGPTLVAWARELGKWTSPASMTRPGGETRTGDVLVFDRAAANAPASLVGVVLATDARGVISFLYLARGVIRIGHVDPTRPTIARDRERRIVNSYIRHTTDHPPAGTRFLAGELLAGAIRLSSSR